MKNRLMYVERRRRKDLKTGHLRHNIVQQTLIAQHYLKCRLLALAAQSLAKLIGTENVNVLIYYIYIFYIFS
jgi:hypothetical protein